MRALPLLGLALLLAACKPKPLPLDVETSYVSSPQGDEIEIRAKTEPGTTLALGGMGAPKGIASVTADDKGTATLHVPTSSLGLNATFQLEAHQGERYEAKFVPIPAVVRWSKEHRQGECFGITDKCGVDVDAYGNVRLLRAQKGAVLSVLGKEATANDVGEAKLKADFFALLDKVSIGDVLRGTGDEPHVVVPVTLKLPSGVVAKGETWALRPVLRIAIDDHYKAVSEGGVDASIAPTGTGLVIAGLNHYAELLGEAKGPGDVRYVAHVSRISHDAGSCGTYETMSDGRKVEVRRTSIDLKVKIHERATGKVLAETTLPGGAPACAAVVSGPGRTLVGDDRESDAKKWVEAWYAKNKG